MTTPLILNNFERCERMGSWSQLWEKPKFTETQMLQEAIRAGLTSTREDFGIEAGEECYGYGVDPGLDTKQMDVHAQVVHLSNLSDIITTAIRKPQDKPWGLAPSITLPSGQEWASDAYLDPSGTHLRRVCLVSNWSDDRHYSECRSWDSLGSVCAYGLPMQMAVCILGQSKNGKRHSFWTHGLRHPVSKQIRFRKKTDRSTPFKDTWVECWRENNDDIETHEWLAAMHADGVLSDLCFKVDIPVPTKEARQHILDLASSKLDRLRSTKGTPEQNLSTCFWPTKCQFSRPCHSGELPSGRFGFVPIV